MIPLFHMELRLSDIGKDWDLRRGSVRLTIKYKLNFLKKVGSHVHNVSEFKNETQTIHQQIYIL